MKVRAFCKLRFNFPMYFIMLLFSIALIIVSLCLDQLSRFRFVKTIVETQVYCEVLAKCGWRTATFKYSGTESTCPIGTYKINYSKACNESNRACHAYNEGNVYFGFSIIAILVLFVHLTIFGSYWSKNKAKVPELQLKRYRNLMIWCSIVTIFLVLISFIVWVAGNSCSATDQHFSSAIGASLTEVPQSSILILWLVIGLQIALLCVGCCGWHEIAWETERWKEKNSNEFTNNNNINNLNDSSDNNNNNNNSKKEYAKVSVTQYISDDDDEEDEDEIEIGSRPRLQSNSIQNSQDQ